MSLKVRCWDLCYYLYKWHCTSKWTVWFYRICRWHHIVNNPRNCYEKYPNKTAERTLNTELANVSKWLKVNKLSLNVNKSKYMIFHTNRKQVNPLHLLIDNTTIERALQLNFLGLTLDENLNLKGYIDQISNKISKSIGILNKLKHFIAIKIKILIYNSLILSYLNYCILAINVID